MIAGFVNDRYGVVKGEMDRLSMISVSEGLGFPFFVKITSLHDAGGLFFIGPQGDGEMPKVQQRWANICTF